VQCKFSVSRFGNRLNQKCLKLLDDPFSNTLGEQILSSFSYDEGTYPATGLLKISEKLWPNSLSNTTTKHRLVIMITDCLTEERDPKDWTKTACDFKFNLGILFINDERQVDHTKKDFLRAVANAHTILDTNTMDNMSAALADLMTKQFGQVLKQIKSNSPQQSQLAIDSFVFVAPSSNYIKADFLPVDKVVNKLAITDGVGPRPQFMYYASPHDAPVPYADKILQQSTPSSPQPHAAAQNYVSAAVAGLHTYYQELSGNSSLYGPIQEAERAWIAAETKLTSQIEGLFSHPFTFWINQIP
jgi:hypothetical protein